MNLINMKKTYIETSIIVIILIDEFSYEKSIHNIIANNPPHIKPYNTIIKIVLVLNPFLLNF